MPFVINNFINNLLFFMTRFFCYYKPAQGTSAEG